MGKASIPRRSSMDAWNTYWPRAWTALGLSRNLRRAWSLVRHHPRRGVEVVALVALAGTLHLLSGWVAQGTGSVGEAQMVRILGAGAQVGWFLLLPLGLVRWWRAGAGTSSSAEVVSEGEPSARDEECWTACGRRLLLALLTVTLAPSAALLVLEVYAVHGLWAPLVVLMATAVVTALVGESMLGHDNRRSSAVRMPVRVVRTAVAASAPPPDVDVDAVSSPVEAESESWRGAAASGRFRARGLPEGVVARAEFFSDLEFDLRRAQRQGRPYMLLIVGPDDSPVDERVPGAARHLLGESLAGTFGDRGLVGYLGGDRWGVGLAGVATDEVSQDVRNLRMVLAERAGAEGEESVAPCIGAAVSLAREPARDLYAKALGSLQSALERSAAGPRVS